MDFIKQYLDIIIASGTILTISVRAYITAKKYLDDNKKMQDMVQKIHSEITPNHGSSIKDKVNKIEQRINNQNEAIDKISKRQFWILDNEPRCLFETDDSGKFLWANKNLKDLLKRDLEFLKGHGWKNIIHDDDREHVVDKFTSCISDGITYEDWFRICDANNKCYKIKCIATKSETDGYMGTIIIENEI